ncbi:YqjF family protein [Blastopirellula retiformator]|uniref:DUF2071 domain-containing protein n=1 Tax=Blastopirellula retiformator TaxID=2527970 RepID=A0A5C5UXT9_9BACT|nr:DUF2071 domain-containing protein [Blastopirellula retiformator]TWT30639.1 hypothetical protein Enr8_41600 [Blastopirellula retiformator]
MTWSELLFAHWPVDAQQLASLIPHGLTLDTYQGKAWIGVVPFYMSDVAPRCSPAWGRLSRFPELNVRTYVTLDDKPGVWFFSLDAASRLAVRAARATFHLPYMDATMSLSPRDDGQVHYRSRRTHLGEPSADFDASYQAIGEPLRAKPGTLEHWLTARYCLYCSDRRGGIYRGEIDHEPWLLSPAAWTRRINTMCQPLGLDLIGDPHLLCAQPISVRAWMATRCD